MNLERCASSQQSDGVKRGTTDLQTLLSVTDTGCREKSDISQVVWKERVPTFLPQESEIQILLPLTLVVFVSCEIIV
ncbi:hypothetical protein F2P81_024753 [Scophthalmus maximus]|uniref:Uncharacterized protein n=1 Tax=Scophthalmus maximus TaxID=52904 RepID=A0A6A4RUP7_SCOMX|nr:hypothetical protein F2P81_024753 [Scophthalmus maximus]